MPNTEELERLTGRVPVTPDEVATAARPLIERGVRAVIATRGAEGMVVVATEGAWSATLPEPLAGNPTGAGDSATAAVIAALSDAKDTPDWPAVLVDAVATSAAAVVIPVAGEIDRRLRTRIAPTVLVERLATPQETFP